MSPARQEQVRNAYCRARARALDAARAVPAGNPGAAYTAWESAFSQALAQERAIPGNHGDHAGLEARAVDADPDAAPARSPEGERLHQELDRLLDSFCTRGFGHSGTSAEDDDTSHEEMERELKREFVIKRLGEEADKADHEALPLKAQYLRDRIRFIQSSDAPPDDDEYGIADDSDQDARYAVLQKACDERRLNWGNTATKPGPSHNPRLDRVLSDAVNRSQKNTDKVLGRRSPAEDGVDPTYDRDAYLEQVRRAVQGRNQ